MGEKGWKLMDVRHDDKYDWDDVFLFMRVKPRD